MFAYMKRGRAFYRDLVCLAMPILIQNLIMQSLALVDVFMVGLLGEAPMAAVTLANTPIFVVQLLAFGLQSGCAVLISQFWGKQDKQAINKVIGIAMLFAGSVCLIFTAVTIAIPYYFMSLFSDNTALVETAAGYIQIAGASYLFNSIVAVYTGANRSMENPKLGLIIFSSSMLLNTFLNWLFIFGNWGAPEMGVRGAALATLLARVFELGFMLLHASLNRRFRLKPALMFRPGRAMIAKFIRYSTPVVLNEALWGLGTSLYPTIMGHMPNSTEILAAYTIAGSVDKICTVAVGAIAGTTAIIVGREIGKGHMDESYGVGACLSTVSFGAGLVIGGVMIWVLHAFIVPVVYPMFGLSPLAAAIATGMQTMTFAFLAPRSYNCTNIVGVLRGGGDVKAAFYVDVLPLWVVALPMAAICGLVLKTDVMWVYAAQLVENGVKFILGFARFRSRKWINDITKMAQ